MQSVPLLIEALVLPVSAILCPFPILLLEGLEPRIADRLPIGLRAGSIEPARAAHHRRQSLITRLVCPANPDQAQHARWQRPMQGIRLGPGNHHPCIELVRPT
jgi:hypothetical protein